MPKRPNELSLHDKRKMLAFYDTGGLRNMCEITAARLLDVTKRTMRMVLADRPAIEADGAYCASSQKSQLRKKLITDMNNIMFQCFTEMINLNLPLDDNILMDRARSLALQMEIPDFDPDMAWIRCWKENRRIPEEHTYSRTRESVIAEKSKLHKDLVEYALSNYDPADIYGLVEIGLHYVTSTPAKPGAPPYAVPDYLVRTICAVYVCNITGADRRTPLVFDKSHRFNGVSPLPDSNHINFHMLKTGEFKSYIKRLDESVAPRKVLLVLDNYSEQPRIQMKNIELKSLPRGTIHPLGVRIANAQRPDGVPDTWEAVKPVYKQWFARGWETITPAIVRDCYRMLRFLDGRAEDGTDVPGPGADGPRPTVIAHTSSVGQTSASNDRPAAVCFPYGGGGGGGTDIQLRIDASDGHGDNGHLIPTSVLNMDDDNSLMDYQHTYIPRTRGHDDGR